jgi:putative component of toxin-antitoxin plasmid stabilization module
MNGFRNKISLGVSSRLILDSSRTGSLNMKIVKNSGFRVSFSGHQHERLLLICAFGKIAKVRLWQIMSIFSVLENDKNNHVKNAS